MNRTTKKTVITLSIVLAISGLDHGFFEILQGSKPTQGLLIQAIGPDHLMWQYGSEEAFSLMPTYLSSGIAAVSLSLFLIFWSVRFLHTQYGAMVLGLLFIGLFLFGGGIAGQVLFAPFVWMAARQINSPLGWWRKVLPEGIRPGLARMWPVTLTLGSLSFLVGLFIAITGYIPGQNNAEVILTICWAFIFIGSLGLYLITIVAGFSHDIEQSNKG